MPRKKTTTAKAREANGDAHHKDTIHSKRAVLDFDSDSEGESANLKSSKKRKVDDDSEEPAFKVNTEYARRFEHNKKREELHRLEEKYGKSSSKRRKTGDSEDDDRDSLASSEESSSSEDEDEFGELVTNGIDAQIKATITAIRSKDPRVYDTKTTFFDASAAGNNNTSEAPKENSMTLKQYHQKNILEGYTGADDEDGEAPPRTYVDEQEHLKKTVVGEMHAAAEGSGDEDEFLIRKPKTAAEEVVEEVLPVALPENPEADPEKFLDAFFSTKAWVPKGAEANIPFESDDSEEEDVAEEFEQMYNMRFEDPTIDDRSKIITHARDIAKQKSLRREEKSKRKKARNEKKEKKQRQEEERATDKNRLRKLRVEELEKKIKMVQEAGGLELEAEPEVVDNKWKKFLDDAWEGDEGWEKRMAELYGDKYYKENEDLEKSESKKSKKPKKPTWDDDIDIKDLVPNFKEDESMSDAEDAKDAEDAEDTEDGGVSLGEPTATEPTSSVPEKQKKGAKKDKRTERLLRAQIESYVDDKLPLSLPGSSKHPGATFRYREVTPESYQLTPTDILFAGDKELNTYAGLKKLASFRDDSKKAKDRKRYAKGKGFKLREWRKEVFGKTEVKWDELNGGTAANKPEKREKKEKKKEKSSDVPADTATSEKKKKRRRKNKGKSEGAEVEAEEIEAEEIEA
ncbi:hypothetical protein ABW20_dc0101615 [Dactylellina cionopaga]|nr:hypothetical protein ABW20_dc0101615 [Dactylellina cionopaga]